jgi:hypothetical protein
LPIIRLRVQVRFSKSSSLSLSLVLIAFSSSLRTSVYLARSYSVQSTSSSSSSLIVRFSPYFVQNFVIVIVPHRSARLTCVPTTYRSSFPASSRINIYTHDGFTHIARFSHYGIRTRSTRANPSPYYPIHLSEPKLSSLASSLFLLC